MSTAGLDGFAPLANAELTALFTDSGQPPAQFQWAGDGHDTAIAHDVTTLIADLHAAAAFIH